MKLEFRRPPKAPILVFDGFATQGLLPILSSGSYRIFANRNSELNIWALLATVLRMKFSWRDYCVSYIRLSRAQLVITCIDSNATFYTLKRSLSRVRFIAIQNSIRGNATPVPGGDLWTMLKASPHQPPEVDYVATFGTAHSDLFRQNIRCATVEIGSTRNNSITRHSTPRRNERVDIGLISSYIEFPRHSEFPFNFKTPIATYLGTNEILIEDYVLADKSVASTIADVCTTENWNLHIAGKRPPDSQFEEAFYRKACEGLQYTYLPKSTEDASYHFLDGCNLVVTIDSTLGYEMIARGAKVLFIAARANFLVDESRQYQFGYPAHFGSEGPFWTSSLDPAHLRRCMTSLLEMSEDEWRESSAFVRQELMQFDPGNSVLRNLIAQLAI